MNRRTLIGLIAGTAVCLTLAGAFMPAGAQDSDPGTPAPNSAIAPAAQAGTAFTFQGQLTMQPQAGRRWTHRER